MQLKTVKQSLVVSFLIHLVYIGGAFIKGYIETKNYQPNLGSQWENTEILQSEVALGVSGSPIFYLFSFIGVALLCEITFIMYKKYFSAQ